MNSVCLAIVQLLAIPGKININTEKLLHYLKTAKEKGADLIVFPECSLTGYSTERAKELAVDKDDSEIQRIRQNSKEAGIAVCFGYMEKTEDGLYITQEITADGQSMYYRKTHLGSKETDVFLEGSEFPVFPEPVCTGIQLCWESHIPEISAAERKQGAELLLVPYASPMSKERCRENWSVHLPARASDNGAYLAACNLLFPGKEDPEELRGGGLTVYDPKGKQILVYFETEEKMLLCNLKGPLPGENTEENMHAISYFDKKRTELFRGKL